MVLNVDVNFLIANCFSYIALLRERGHENIFLSKVERSIEPYP